MWLGEAKHWKEKLSSRFVCYRYHFTFTYRPSNPGVYEAKKSPCECLSGCKHRGTCLLRYKSLLRWQVEGVPGIYVLPAVPSSSRLQPYLLASVPMASFVPLPQQIKRREAPGAAGCWNTAATPTHPPLRPLTDALPSQTHKLFSSEASSASRIEYRVRKSGN